MRNRQQSILRLLYRTRRRRALDVETIRKRCKINDWQTALNLCLALQRAGKIIGAETPNGWVFWSDFTELCEDAVRLPHEISNPVMVGAVSPISQVRREGGS